MKLSNLTLSPTEIQAIQKALPTMSLREKVELMDVLEEREKRYKLVAGRTDMIKFAQHYKQRLYFVEGAECIEVLAC